jgi:acyl-CoA thioesterase YciA
VLFRENSFFRGFFDGAFLYFFSIKIFQLPKYESELIMNSPVIKYSQIVMPQDANVLGTLFGGQMVSWMDIAAAKAVHRFLKGTPADAALTRAIDAIEFKETVHVGNWVNFEAQIVSTGKSSINIQIDAYKETKNVERLLACTARFTFVSVKKLQDGSYEKIAHDKNH